MNKSHIIAIAISLMFSAGGMTQAGEDGGKAQVAKSKMNTGFKPTEGALYQVRVNEADADYSEAREKCDDQAGNVKGDCVKEAKAAAVATKADAKVLMKNATAKEKEAKKSERDRRAP